MLREENVETCFFDFLFFFGYTLEVQLLLMPIITQTTSPTQAYQYYIQFYQWLSSLTTSYYILMYPFVAWKYVNAVLKIIWVTSGLPSAAEVYLNRSMILTD